MLRGRFEAAGELSPEELRAAYDDLLCGTIDRVGLETVAERTGLDRETLSALVAGERPELTVAEAAAILATNEELPDADAIEAESRDVLLMGMSTAVLDVEALARDVEGRLEPKEIQAKIEGRFPLTLDEYAHLHSYIEGQKR